MTRCNGSCSRSRGTRARRTWVGWACRSAGREERCSGVLCEYCDEVAAEGLAVLDELPGWHRDWDLTNLDVPETGQAPADKQPKSLTANALEVSDAAQ